VSGQAEGAGALRRGPRAPGGGGSEGAGRRARGHASANGWQRLDPQEGAVGDGRSAGVSSGMGAGRPGGTMLVQTDPVTVTRHLGSASDAPLK
jgi:hypothetical protein